MSTSVILIGATTTIGRRVTELLRPEFSVVRFIQTLETAKIDIPKILSSQALSRVKDEVGSLDFSKPVEAVFVGGAFSEVQVNEVRALCTRGVPWLIRGPNAETRLPPPGPAYAEAAVKSIKSVMAELRGSGKVNGDGLYEW